ncbi:MAG: ribonuclease Y [Candidatus Omnitrophica bacterium]|nr:ribonuclease Y [Candidatus Omnitrophota bacterium]MCM8793558.1 ribonuclease Y [Candidatus Omnitrophota bacterium]
MNILSLRLTMIFIISMGLAFFLGYILRKIKAEKKVKKAEELAKHILEEAKKQAEAKSKETEIEAKELLHKLRQDFERETRERRQELQNLEKRILQREENLDKKVDLLDHKEKELNQKEQGIIQKETRLKEKETELEQLITQEKEQLQRISNLTPEQARELLLQRIEQEVRKEASLMIKKIEEEARQEAEKKAKEIISLAIQRCAAEHTVETTVSVVSLPSDEMKGRIIGREGRNIRAFEMATGVDVIIDDTPEAVTLSGFDPVRREIARIALERLIEDGRIHPARIEEIVEKVKKEMEESIQEEGKNTAMDLGIHNLHPELIKLLGRLKYRTSYGQNVLQHSKEVAYLMGVMASQLGLDFHLARRAGLLHDIGKAVDHEVEGTHPQIGMELAKKYGEPPEVVQAVGAHHEDIEQRSIYAVLAQAADAVSSSRPGARRETLEAYIKRLEKLEAVADSFPGVEKAFAIQAGREIRVMVYPDKVSDAETLALAREIKKKIEEGLEYPGQIKIVIIRETRAIEYAK